MCRNPFNYTDCSLYSRSGTHRRASRCWKRSCFDWWIPPVFTTRATFFFLIRVVLHVAASLHVRVVGQTFGFSIITQQECSAVCDQSLYQSPTQHPPPPIQPRQHRDYQIPSLRGLISTLCAGAESCLYTYSADGSVSKRRGVWYLIIHVRLALLCGNFTAASKEPNHIIVSFLW